MKYGINMEISNININLDISMLIPDSGMNMEMSNLYKFSIEYGWKMMSNMYILLLVYIAENL